MMKSPNRQNNIEAIYPLSPMQQGMLFHTIYYPTSGEYFEQLSCTLAGDLDMDAFIKAWQQAVNRHTILRTSFVWKKLDKMLQVVHRQINVPYKILNWQHLSKKEQEAEFGKFLKQDRIKGFDLSKAPLVRFVSIRISESQYKFVMSHHHVLIDGWSLPILLKEVFTFYAAFHEGNDLKLSPARPYHDYINWLQRQDMTKAERFWRSYLKGFVAPTPIPLLRRTEDEVNRYQSYSKERITLPASDTQALQQLARENKITLSTVIQGAWALLLHKYTGEDDIIFGMTVSGRPAELPDVESMIGLFINTLPVRIKIRNNMPVWKWLKKLQADQIELRDYEFTPLVQIQGWSEISRNLPLFQSLVVFENYPLDSSLRVQVENLNFQDIKTYSRTNYPINLISAPEDEIPLILAYDSSRFERKAVRRMLAHLQILLSSFATQIDKPMIDLSVLTDEELDLLKKKWVGTQTDYGEGECISVLFEEQVSKTPDRIALSHGTHDMTYHELNRQANKLACYLRKIGVVPESIVGLYIDRSMEMIIGILAILKAGGAYLPLDPHYPRQRLEYMIEDSGSTILLTTQELKEIASGYQCKVVCLDLDASKLDSEDDNNPTANITSQNLAYIIYTSGSTGKPKGTMMEHHGIGNLIDNMRRDFRVSEESRHLQFASFSFDASIGEIFVTLLSGGTLILADHETLMSTDDLFRLLNDQKITHVVMPPSLLAILPNAPLPYMKTVVSAGESCSREVARRWSKDYHFLNGYGPTETTVGCSWGILGQQSPEAESAPIGRAIDNVQIYLLDSYSNLVPPGVSGELCIGGAGLGRGYLNRPDLTAEKFIPNPFANTPGERLYRTGDLARYLPNGELEFEGRIDHQVKIRGFRVELGEIDLILRKHSQVKDVVITLSEDKQNSKVLLAFIITEEKESFNINGLRDYCRQHLPEYMIPSSFIRLEKFPLLPNGKVDRKALPIPDGQISAGSDNYAAPRTPVEELLAGIWSDILQKNHIGVNDNFFDLGGHSLKMTQLSSRIRQIFQTEIPLRVLFESPTISKIAERIKVSGNGRDTLSLPPIRRIPRDGELSLSFTQQRLWFLDQLVPDSNYYNINSAVRLQGGLNFSALESSLQEIVNRHEVLRTLFISSNGKPHLLIKENVPANIELIDLTELGADMREAEAARLATRSALLPFFLSTGPLFRFKLYRLNTQEHLLLIAIHHIVADGWSMGVFVKELSVLYDAFCRELASPLPELPIQYLDYANWQREWLQGQILEEQINYWKDQLSGDLPIMELPFDRPRPPLQTFNGASTKFSLSASLYNDLREKCRETGVTPFMFLLAAFQTFLYQYSHQNDILVGSPIANRTHFDSENLIGFFVNTLVFRARFDNQFSFIDVLRHIREVTLGAYAHQDLPFEQLVELLEPERDMSRSPLFQVAFVFQNFPIKPIELSGLKITPYEIESGISKYDLILTLSENDNGMIGYFEYNTDLFDKSTILRMSLHFQTLLEKVVHNPKQVISNIPIMPVAEYDQVVKGWNETRRTYPDSLCVHEWFEKLVEAQPDSISVTFTPSESMISATEQMTYSELNREANQLAHYLRKLGVENDVPVGIFVNRSLEMVAGILAVLKAGGAFLPIDPSYPGERLAYMLNDSKIPVLLSRESLLDLLPNYSGKIVCFDRDEKIIASQNNENPKNFIHPDNLAYVIYTSGSTGKPKGTMLAHRGLCNLAIAQQDNFGVKTGSRIFQFSSLSFDASVWEFVMALLSGATLNLASLEVVTSGQALVHMLRQMKVTTITLPPSVLSVLPQEPLPDLDTIIVAGEKCSGELVAHWNKKRRFFNAYGPTETTVCASMHLCQGTYPQGPPIGKPIANFRLYVLDEFMQPVPVGVGGELHIGGVGLARGYLNHPDLTAEKFVPDPFSQTEGERLYKSGDLVKYHAAGNIEFIGRKDNQVKIRGFRIELGEIESALIAHPSVREAKVIARNDVAGDARLVAYMVSENGRTTDKEVLQNFLRKSLPEYMIPPFFVVLEQMPLTPNGKIDRRALPKPDNISADPNADYLAPRNEIEEKIVDISSQLLGAEKIGVHDNFFKLGGHSLLATQFLSRLQTAFRIKLPLRQIFETPTIEGLAHVIREIQERQETETDEKIGMAERGDTSLDDLLADLTELSDEEARTLLEKETQSRNRTGEEND